MSVWLEIYALVWADLICLVIGVGAFRKVLSKQWTAPNLFWLACYLGNALAAGLLSFMIWEQLS